MSESQPHGSDDDQNVNQDGLGDEVPGSELTPSQPARTDGSSQEDILGEILDQFELPPERRDEVIEIAIAQRLHRGPMPDAETLAGYKQVDERLIDEVLDGAKENRRHRVSMDQRLSNTARLSLILSAALVAMAIIAAVLLTLNGHPVIGGIFGAGGLATIIGTLIRGGGLWSGKGRRDTGGS